MAARPDHEGGLHRHRPQPELHAPVPRARARPGRSATPTPRNLAKLLGCKPQELRLPEPPRRRPQKRRRRTAPPLSAPLVAIPEMEVEAAAGAGALNEEFAGEKARWYLPEGHGPATRAPPIPSISASCARAAIPWSR